MPLFFAGYSLFLAQLFNLPAVGLARKPHLAVTGQRKVRLVT